MAWKWTDDDPSGSGGSSQNSQTPTQAGNPQSGSPSAYTGYGPNPGSTQGTTFAQMQSHGQARPGPSFMYRQDGGGGYQDGTQGTQGSSSGDGNGPAYPGFYPRQPVNRPPSAGPAPTPWNTQNPGGQSFGPQLQSMYQNWQPGANPFQTAYAPGGYTGPGFTATQAPITQQSAQFSAPTNPVMDQTGQAVSSFLQNPNSFSTPAVKQSYDYLSQNIDDQFKQAQTQLGEQMAQRGLSDSSIAGGRLSDLNVAKKSASEQLASQLLTEQAQTGSQAQASAIAAGLGYGGQQFNQALQGNQANLDVNAQNFGQNLAQAAFSGDQNAMAVMQNLNIGGFNNAAAQQGFSNNLAGYGANLAGNQQNFGQQQQLLSNMLGYEQQGFQNQLGTAQFNAQQNQWYQTLLAQLAMSGSQPSPTGTG